MLRSLSIQNYALIAKLDIDFEAGFSVITGETGAGKSIILGAIGLLLGQRADTKTIRQGANKCVIEARFNVAEYNLQVFFDESELDYEDDCFLRREILASGKSRAFINDTPVSLSQMKQLSEQLIDVHSQHQNLLLNNENFQLSVLDILAGNETLTVEYSELYRKWKLQERELAELIAQSEQSKTDEDYLRFQLKQLEEANIQEHELEELEQESETLTHAEEIKAGLCKVDEMFLSDEEGVLTMLKNMLNTLNGLKNVYSPSEELVERIESCYIELKDISHEVSNRAETITFDPQRLEIVNDRLNLMYTLQQKHHVQTIQELLELTEEYRKKLQRITSFDEEIAALKDKIQSLYSQIKNLAVKLTARRLKAALEVEKQMTQRLIPLGMPNIRFKVDITERKELNATGHDSVNFLFAANKSGSLQPLSAVASGGEIARVMLSVKAMIAGAIKLPTIIFDEIDIGVSGEIADRMADIMYQMGNQKRQVISITHLPQIAARGTAHYFVYKEDSETETHSHIRKLTEDERVNELAQMLSGSTLTKAALDNARALLKRSNE